MCVIWREEDEVEEETKSREKKKKRERERERARGAAGIVIFPFFRFLFRLGRRELRKGRTRTLPYRMVTLLSLPGQSP